AVVCAVITWPAVKIPGVRAVFGEGGPRNPHTLPRPPWPSRRRRPRPRDPGPRDPADAASRTGTDSVQPPRRARAPEPDLGAPPGSVDSARERGRRCDQTPRQRRNTGEKLNAAASVPTAA